MIRIKLVYLYWWQALARVQNAVQIGWRENQKEKKYIKRKEQ